PRVGIDQQLAGVPPQALARVERSVDPEAVALPRAYPRQVAVPDVVSDVFQRDAFLRLPVEQAQLDRLCCGREQREVRALAVPCRAERERRPGPAVVLDVGHGLLPPWPIHSGPIHSCTVCPELGPVTLARMSEFVTLEVDG